MPALAHAQQTLPTVQETIPCTGGATLASGIIPRADQSTGPVPLLSKTDESLRTGPRQLLSRKNLSSDFLLSSGADQSTGPVPLLSKTDASLSTGPQQLLSRTHLHTGPFSLSSGADQSTGPVPLLSKTDVSLSTGSRQLLSRTNLCTGPFSLSSGADQSTGPVPTTLASSRNTTLILPRLLKGTSTRVCVMDPSFVRLKTCQ